MPESEAVERVARRLCRAKSEAAGAKPKCSYPDCYCNELATDGLVHEARAAIDAVLGLLEARIEAGHASKGHGHGFRVLSPREFIAAARRDMLGEEEDG